MNKEAKVVLTIMITIIVIYVAVGLFKNSNNIIDGEQNPSGDIEITNSGDFDNEDLIHYEYPGYRIS